MAALLPYALCTLAELVEAFPVSIPSQTGKEAHRLRACINRATREVEGYLGRRIVFRAPTEDDDAIVADTALDGATTLTLVGTSITGGRTLVVTVTDADYSLTAGTLTVTGTVGGTAGVTEVFDLTGGYSSTFGASGLLVFYGVKFFTAISAAAVSGETGATTSSDRIKVGTSLGYVDYFSPCSGAPRPADLWLPDWPVKNVHQVYESTARTYDSDSLLVEGTDFVVAGSDVARPYGVLRRTADATSGLQSWDSGYRAVKATWSGGFFGTANVPSDLKTVAMQLAKLYYDAEGRSELGLTTRGDATGSWTRSYPPGLTREHRAVLDRYSDQSFKRDYERAFDLEAA